MVDNGSPSKFMQVWSKCVLLHISFKLESESQKLYRLKKKMERQLHHTSDGSAIITNTPPQPQDGKTMVMAQIHPCWHDLASVMAIIIAWLVEAFLLILMGWIDFGRIALVEAFLLIFWCKI
ncbi:uncharacterized protein LOC131322782 isoform X1 [Rhododendron vialii]|uniref:uncharacterized protein LOC131322782 isoform X1 n=1 Tax=Rhododendron vialii TaxID=182163 RepID=UPI00265E3E65|nr:uncharacterized protein LOC131322782 isoform X1 [Rhododendron vialii]